MAGSKGRPNFIRALLPPAFWLGAWQLAAWLVELHVEGRGNELLLPYPLTVLAALAALVGQVSFWASVGATFLRVAAGLFAGVVLGGLLAGLTCASSWCARLLSPPIRIIRATPVVSFILLVLLWTQRDQVPAIISALMVLPVTWENLVHGIEATDAQLLELARAYRFSRSKAIRLIYLPSLRPYFLSALITSVGLAWKSGVAAEVLCTPSLAMGTQIYSSKLSLEIPDLFARTAVVGALSLALERGLRLMLEQKGGTQL